MTTYHITRFCLFCINYVTYLILFMAILYVLKLSERFSFNGTTEGKHHLTIISHLFNICSVIAFVLVTVLLICLIVETTLTPSWKYTLNNCEKMNSSYTAKYKKGDTYATGTDGEKIKVLLLTEKHIGIEPGFYTTLTIDDHISGILPNILAKEVDFVDTITYKNVYIGEEEDSEIVILKQPNTGT